MTFEFMLVICAGPHPTQTTTASKQPHAATHADTVYCIAESCPLPQWLAMPHLDQDAEHEAAGKTAQRLQTM